MKKKVQTMTDYEKMVAQVAAQFFSKSLPAAIKAAGLQGVSETYYAELKYEAVEDAIELVDGVLKETRG